MRIARHHELVDAERVVLLHAVGDVGVAADQRRARATAHQADAGPQVGADLEGVGGAAVQGAHAALAHRLAGAQHRLGALDLRGVQGVEQSLRDAPRLVGGVARDDVQADAEPRLAVQLGGELAHPLDLLGDLLRRLAPGEVDVGVACGHGQRGVRRAAEVDRRRRVGRGERRRPLHAVVLAGEVDRLGTPGSAQDGEELVGAGVAGVVVGPVAEAPHLDRVAAGDDVEHQPAAGEALERRGLLGGERGGDEARAGTRPCTAGGGSPGAAPPW